MGAIEIPLTSLRNSRTIPHIVKILGVGVIPTSIIIVRRTTRVSRTVRDDAKRYDYNTREFTEDDKRERQDMVKLPFIDVDFLHLALVEADKSYREGGIPIGAVMVENGRVIAAGHNRRVQNGDPIAHGEMDCIRRAGRRPRYDRVTLYTTLSPCMMCAGTILQFGIPRVVIGENVNFPGSIDFLRTHGVEVTLLNDPDCADLLRKFISTHPEVWDEDIAGRSDV